MRFVLLFILFLSFDAHSQVRPFQTARLNSSAGAGVASILVTESAILNPSTLAFFNETFVSYQKSNGELKSESDDRRTDGAPFSKTNYQEGYFLFDNASSIKGGFSYQMQRENGFLRRRSTATMASNITPNMSLGLLYKYTQDTRPASTSRKRHITSHPVTLGYSWIAHSSLVVGATWDDPGRAISGESRATVGAQYSITEKFFLITDAGGDPTVDFVDKRLWRAALQYNLFADFFVRAGKFEDKALNFEGTSWGVSWTGPKLGADFAMKNSRQIKKEKSYLYPNESLSEVSFALNVRF